MKRYEWKRMRAFCWIYFHSYSACNLHLCFQFFPGSGWKSDMQLYEEIWSVRKECSAHFLHPRAVKFILVLISPGEWKWELLPFIFNYNLTAGAANIFVMKILNKDGLTPTQLSLIFPLIIYFFAKTRIFLTIYPKIVLYIWL